MAKKKIKTTTLEQLETKYFGKKGTASRTKWDKHVSVQIQKHKNKKKK